MVAATVGPPLALCSVVMSIDRSPPSEAWRAWPRERLEREYSPRSCVPSIEPYLAACATRSQEALHALDVRPGLRYGDGPDETLDLFPAGGAGAPLAVFFHGGYWQEPDRRDSLFPALGFVPNGVAYAAVDHALAPRATLAEIVDQARRSVAWLARNANELGFDRRRLVVSGHSAGAHLAAMVLLTDWRTFDLPPDTVRGGVLVSGVYDLEPLVGTHVNDALGLDAPTARALSPRRSLPDAAPVVTPVAPEARLPVLLRRGTTPRVRLPAVVAWGSNETSEFRRQSVDFAAGWSALGHPVDVFEVPERNHFDVILDLGDPATQLGAAAYRLLGLRCG